MNISLNGLWAPAMSPSEAAEGLTEGVLAQDFRKPYRRCRRGRRSLHRSGAVGPGRPGPLPALGHLHRGLHRRRPPTLGYDMLAADASGGIKTTEAGGRTVLVTAVDSTAMTAEILL